MRVSNVETVLGRCCTRKVGVTLLSVPTERPRLTITETDDIAAALDAAAARWPDVRSRRELLLRLVGQSHEVIENERGGGGDPPRGPIPRPQGRERGGGPKERVNPPPQGLPPFGGD